MYNVAEVFQAKRHRELVPEGHTAVAFLAEFDEPNKLVVLENQVLGTTWLCLMAEKPYFLERDKIVSAVLEEFGQQTVPGTVHMSLGDSRELQEVMNQRLQVFDQEYGS